MLKKTMTIILTALMLMSLAACGTQNGGTTAESTAASSTQEINSTDNPFASSSETVSDETVPENTSTKRSNTKKTASAGESVSGTSSAPAQESTDSSPVSQKSSDTVSDSQDSTDDTAVSFSGSAGGGDTGSYKSTESDADVHSAEASDSSEKTTYTANTTGKLDTADLFSERDLKQTADTSGAATITAQDNKTETITEGGVYILTGTASNFTVKVEADKEAKVQLVLDGLNVTNSSFPVIYVVSADKCFVTTTATDNTLSVTGAFTADGDTNTDAVIYSKDDLVFNGTGTLTVISSAGNGISGKDDVKFTGGSYIIQSAKDSIEANDSIAVYDGAFTITSGKDGLHSEDSDDDTTGYIYIRNGSFTINAASDAIQATTVCQIDGGTLDLTASEGIEGTYIQINGGDITINASDDGINGARKSNSMGTPVIEFNGGHIRVTVGQGDTDGIDSNGNIIVNGGTIEVTAQMSSFDYDGTAQYNGGTIIVNGTQVNSIPQSMMGGGMGRGGMNGGFGRW